MSAAAFLLLQLASQSAALPPSPPPAAIVVPSDWSSFPLLPWRVIPHITPDLAAVVAHEVAAGKCAVTDADTLVVDMAVLARGDGGVRAVVPRAIGCATVEQYAAGLVTSFARNNLRRHAVGWYRVTIAFDLR